MTDAYRFGDGIPIDPVAPGSTLLVAGSALTRTDDLARSMVVDGADDGEGSLFVATNSTWRKLLSACQQTHPGLDSSRLAVVDCSGQDFTQTDDVQVKYISTQSDLTGIGMKFSRLYESLYADATNGRVRTGLLSLSSLAMYVDMRSLYRFAQTITARIESAGGLGVFTVDPTTHDTKVVNTLSQAMDGRIEVRETDDEGRHELRVRGLLDQPSGWQAFEL